MDPTGVLSAGLTYLGAREANQANREMAREQMDFQERMSNTAYQRSMQDMRAAGLNPILAFNQGGASAPSGSSAQMQNEMAGAVSSALDAKRFAAEIKNLQSQNKVLESQAELNRNSAKSAALTIPGKEVEAEIDSSNFGKIMRYIQRANPLRYILKK